MTRKEVEDSNTFARCVHCDRRIGRAAIEQTMAGTVVAWSCFDVVSGGTHCQAAPVRILARTAYDAAMSTLLHEPSLPEDLSRDALERWLSR